MSEVHSLPVLESKRHPARAPDRVDARRRLIDSHGRTIRELRLSITDRCNFRCVYCMEPDVKFTPEAELLSVEELVRLARLCVRLGVESVRLTGGEPTLHPELERLIAAIADLGVTDLSMTTNGSVVDELLVKAWKRAGLRRLTFSLDSLRSDVFRAMTRSRTSADRVVRSIELAKAVGLGPIKVNAVIVRGLNEDEVPALTRLAIDLDIEMRFIEYMPLDSGHAWEPAKLVPADEILQRASTVGELRPLGRGRGSSTSETYVFADGRAGRVGLIAPVTRSFCGQCSRLRITADGQVRPCLFSRDEYDARSLLRSGATDAQIEEFLIDSTWSKQAGHGITSPDFVQPARPMSAIGG